MKLAQKAKKVINKVSEALENKKLPPAPEKIECVFLAGNRKVEDIKNVVQGVKIKKRRR